MLVGESRGSLPLHAVGHERLPGQVGFEDGPPGREEQKTAASTASTSSERHCCTTPAASNFQLSFEGIIHVIRGFLLSLC